MTQTMQTRVDKKGSVITAKKRRTPRQQKKEKKGEVSELPDGKTE